MFIGEYNHNIDNKGRISMPAKFRDLLGDNFIATKGLDNCLFVYPMDEWKIVEGKLKSLPMTNVDARAFVRFFFSGASECELDNQGRIRLPNNLRDHAFLDKETVIIGVGTRIEIWSLENWEKYNSGENLSFNEIASKMQELGI
ncbi:division/cell wall cluster transcriptional repressor MraZ [Serpentinicella alkaliphila]|uniref:Transcriptional regulator MraZ n=1 Tax=Serpentinicella alkaliphila TaxID=1734049 RepID=A0A4R2UCL2_9FIRM|nr:division/cell wall cluster transcriptional repressor MraZ [Serpentinicella alkaliphila]QUH26778.1 division/cell wall cluster transcriptional repressor MraZ [Serpentinicella alkaliphila]TCQ07999.1 MraZ protein [Serpentinicella alkaliphila]